jgi:hypothetical protein
MNEVPHDQTQSGGLNNEGGTINTGGGDIIGRDQFSPRNSNNIDLRINGDRSPEQLVKVLRSELDKKSNQIEALSKQNESLSKRMTGIDAVFRMVTITIGEHFLSVNDYILHTCNFLNEKNLKKEFQTYLPIAACKVGKKDG